MQIICGKKKVEKAIKKQLNLEKEKFRSRIKGRESKFLFVLLQSLNYVAGRDLLIKQDGMIDKINVPAYWLILSLKAMLDIILRSRITAVQVVGKNEFVQIFTVLREHLAIGFLLHMLHMQKIYPLHAIKVNDAGIVEAQERSDELYKAFKSWVDVAGLDPHWINWYLSSFAERRAKVGNLLRKNFKETLHVEPDDLYNISEFFKSVSEDHLEKAKRSLSTMPFLYIKRKPLKMKFRKHMSNTDTQRWFELLKYKPGRDFYKSPLIPIKFNGKKAYVLMTWVFIPSNHFWGTWITDMLLDNLKLGARGKWADQYGKTFQNYTDEKLAESGLPITNLGSRKISVDEYPEIKPWLNKLPQKEGFEVDRLIKYDKVLFVVSCKANDFLYDRKAIRRAVIFRKEEIEKRVTKNLEDMAEIQVVTDCIRSCEEMRKELNLEADRFVPVVLTSIVEPLGCAEVRSYYSARRGVKLPEAHIMTIPQFIDMVNTWANCDSTQ